MREFALSTGSRCELVDISASVEASLRDSGVREGLVTVFVPHTTAGVTINENADPDVKRDMLRWMAKAIPRDPAFAHSEGNSDAHIKASLMGSSVSVPVSGGSLALGTWQGIYFCEFDGPRTRGYFVQVIGS